MQDLFEKEAIENNVYPLDDRLYERFNAKIAGRPDLMGDRKISNACQWYGWNFGKHIFKCEKTLLKP